MTLIDIILKETQKNANKFEKTEDIKKTDIIILNAKNTNLSEAIFVTRFMGKSYVGYSLNQQGQLREATGTIDLNKNNYSGISMYSVKNKESIFWKSSTPTYESVSKYFN